MNFRASRETRQGNSPWKIANARRRDKNKITIVLSYGTSDYTGDDCPLAVAWSDLCHRIGALQKPLATMTPIRQRQLVSITIVTQQFTHAIFARIVSGRSRSISRRASTVFTIETQQFLVALAKVVNRGGVDQAVDGAVAVSWEERQHVPHEAHLRFQVEHNEQDQRGPHADKDDEHAEEDTDDFEVFVELASSALLGVDLFGFIDVAVSVVVDGIFRVLALVCSVSLAVENAVAGEFGVLDLEIDLEVAVEGDRERDEDADDDVEEGIRVDVVGEGADKVEVGEAQVTPTDVVRQVEQVDNDPDGEAVDDGIATGVDFVVVPVMADEDESVGGGNEWWQNNLVLSE